MCVLGPEQGANALKQRRARRWQFGVALGHPAHQSERQRVTVQLFQTVSGEMVEHMIGIHARMLRKKVGARVGAIERFERQDFGIGTIKLAQARHAARLPLARSTREDEGRDIGLFELRQDCVDCVALAVEL